MNEDEIRAFLALAETARTWKLPVWKHLPKTIPAFDFDLREPKAGETGVLATDKGPVIPSKLYRRYANWSARKKAKVTGQNFQKFLGEGCGGKPDTCYETGDFLANGVPSATPRNFAEFVEGGKDDQVSAGGAGVRGSTIDAGRGGWEDDWGVLRGRTEMVRAIASNSIISDRTPSMHSAKLILFLRFDLLEAARPGDKAPVRPASSRCRPFRPRPSP